MSSKKITGLLLTLINCAALFAQSTVTVTSWTTDPVNLLFFAKNIQKVPVQKTPGDDHPVIRINEQQRYQSIDGFGFALTGGSAMLMMHMNEPSRAALIREMFATDGDNIGTSYLRISIGASDLDELVFSYDDLPAGAVDTELKHFDLGYDKKYLIPVLKEILQINPEIKIMGSPWSPPAWMKTNNDTKGGSLKPEYFAVYANYFVKYIQAMKKEGIRIDAITVQNEPLHPGNNPSLFMPANEQALFVKKHLGPAFKKEGIDTKIIIYDHNADKPEYPISILNDREAKQYIYGSAFHLYGGTIDALSKVHEAHPDKQLYFTEQWVGAPGNFKEDIRWHVEQLVIGGTRNWSRTELEWNFAADPQQKPHTDRGGCIGCLGAVTIDKERYTRNPAYYTIAHASKMVRPGSIRISSNVPEHLSNAAFITPSGKTVLIVVNAGATEAVFDIGMKSGYFTQSLSPGTIATYSW
jgi:glucosylceramidase